MPVAPALAHLLLPGKAVDVEAAGEAVGDAVAVLVDDRGRVEIAHAQGRPARVAVDGARGRRACDRGLDRVPVGEADPDSRDVDHREHRPGDERRVVRRVNDHHGDRAGVLRVQRLGVVLVHAAVVSSTAIAPAGRLKGSQPSFGAPVPSLTSTSVPGVPAVVAGGL